MTPIEWHIFTCDCCSRKAEYSYRAQIMPAAPREFKCTFCKIQCCKVCTTHYSEDSDSEYAHADGRACKNCKPVADMAWQLTLETAGRHDHLDELFKQAFRELKEAA